MRPRRTDLAGRADRRDAARDRAWRVRRLSPLAGERDGADRASWKRCVSEVCDDRRRRDRARARRSDRHDARRRAVPRHRPRCRALSRRATTLPLEWITRSAAQLSRGSRGRRRARSTDRTTTRLARRARDGRARHVVAIERSEGGRSRCTRCSTARAAPRSIRQTGTITLRSLGDHLAHRRIEEHGCKSATSPRRSRARHRSPVRGMRG